MKNLSGARLGVLFIFTFNLLSASKGVLVGHLIQGTAPIVVAFWTFGVAALVFFALNLPYGRLLQTLRENLGAVLCFNVTTAGAWLTYFYALKFLEPAVDAALAFAVGPVLTCVFWKALRPTNPVMRSEKLASLGIFASVIFLTLTTLSGKAGLTSETGDAVVGIACAVLSGVCVVGNTIFSKRLSERGISATRVMGLRFWFLLLICLVLWPAEVAMGDLPRTLLISFLFVGIVGIVLPLFILQLGIERSEPITVALILATLPAVSFLIQLLDKRITFSFGSFLGIVGCVGFTILGTKLRLMKSAAK